MKTKFAVIITLIAFSFSGMSQKKWTLKEAVDHALEHNITIKQNELNVELSKEDVVQAKGNFLPSLSASSSGSLGFGSTFDRVSNNRVSSTTFGSSFGLNSGISIFNGFRNLNSYKQAQLGVESSKLDLAKIKDDISLNVVNAYLNILFAKENLSVARVQYEISKKQIERAKNQVEAGAKAKGELLNVQSTAAADAQNVVAQENTLDLAFLSLAQLLQVSAENFDIANLDVGSPSIATLYEDSNIVYKKAVTNRPEILKAKIGVKNSDLGIEIAKGRYLPSLSGSVGASTNFAHAFELIQGSNTYFFKQINDNLGTNLGLSLSIPIFNRFQTKSNVSKSKINKEISEYNLESQKLQLQQTIQKVFLDAKSAAKTYEAAKTSLEAQQEAFKNAQERYNYGAMTLFDFDQVRNRLVNAESTLIRSKYDYVFKTKVLKFYYGESILD
jgi:outer membrane protein